VGGSRYVLYACRALRVERLIHTSSSEVYGTAVYAPIDEKHPVQAQSPYSASKIGADMLVESYVCSYEVPATIVRPFNTFGPRQSARAVIPTIITQALTGPCVRLGDLAPRRDLVYVDDTVSGLIRLAEVPETVGEVINLGTGRDYAIEELVQRVGSLVGKQLEIVFDPTRLRPRRSEVLRLQADASKARKFGWAPATALDDGLHATIQWISNSMTLYRVGAYNI
jgi:nucleoside-diphosphate-sugar epimerase